jgi:hypothetical protein
MSADYEQTFGSSVLKVEFHPSSFKNTGAALPGRPLHIFPQTFLKITFQAGPNHVLIALDSSSYLRYYPPARNWPGFYRGLYNTANLK